MYGKLTMEKIYTCTYQRYIPVFRLNLQVELGLLGFNLYGLVYLG